MIGKPEIHGTPYGPAADARSKVDKLKASAAVLRSHLQAGSGGGLEMLHGKQCAPGRSVLSDRYCRMANR
jgi:hypothetical protein